MDRLASDQGARGPAFPQGWWEVGVCSKNDSRASPSGSFARGPWGVSHRSGATESLPATAATTRVSSDHGKNKMERNRAPHPHPTGPEAAAGSYFKKKREKSVTVILTPTGERAKRLVVRGPSGQLCICGGSHSPGPEAGVRTLREGHTPQDRPLVQGVGSRPAL